MNLLYADTSAIVRAYFEDEEDHQKLRLMILDSKSFVMSSELARTEFASAVYEAHRAGRLPNPRPVLDRFDVDCGPEGPIVLLRLDAAVVFPAAASLFSKHPLKSLDAIHLAVALSEHDDDTIDFQFASRDEAQSAAARTEGLTVV